MVPDLGESEGAGREMTNNDLGFLLGKRLLVGITYLDADDEVLTQVEYVGVVSAVDPMVAVDCGADEPFTLPPDPDAFERAAPGEYRLSSTGETVVDPDYITVWTVQADDVATGPQ